MSDNPQQHASNTGNIPLLRVTGLKRYFDVSKPLLNRLLEGKPRMILKAVSGIDFEIIKGQTFALVGESGCGKSTVANLVVGLHPPTSGKIEFEGVDMAAVTNRAQMEKLRRRMAMIFQDPYASLNPRLKVFDIITEPMALNGAKTGKATMREKAQALLHRVGLGPEHLDRYPHQFSGGQRQRIGIARALSVEPELIIADEPVSALDVSIQAQILNLMMDLKDEFGFSYLFITHDLSVVRHISDRIGVMYLGFLVETGPSDEVFLSPRHPYTRALLLAVPLPDPHRKTEPFAIEGDVPSPIDPPTGCTFHPRCPYRFDRCSQQKPPLAEAVDGHFVACWLNRGRGMTNDD